MLHPIPVGRAPREPGTGLRPSHEPRLIAGVPVEPLRPIGSASTSKSRSVTGAALRSDFAVDHTSHQPVSDVVGAAPPATTRGDFHSAPPRPVTLSAAPTGAQQTAQPMRPAPPSPQRPNYPAQGLAEHPASRPSTPAYAPAPAYIPRSAPPPSQPPAPRAAPTAPSAPAPAAPRSIQTHPS
jgi:hypothetical protein